MSAVLTPSRTVATAVVGRPKVHRPTATVAQLRAFFRDDHVHMALLVDRGKLIGTVERADLGTTLSGATAALRIAKLEGRTIAPDAALSDALEAMKRAGRRRLAVTNIDGTLVGLLCLKASGVGFCSDRDVRSRREPAPT
jgi:predicted transcriptional regulator